MCWPTLGQKRVAKELRSQIIYITFFCKCVVVGSIGAVKWEPILNRNVLSLASETLDNRSLSGSASPPVTMSPRHFNRKSKKTHFWAALTSIALYRSVAILKSIASHRSPPRLWNFANFRHNKDTVTLRDPWKKQCCELRLVDLSLSLSLYEQNIIYFSAWFEEKAP